MLGSTFGRYIVKDRLGTGGMAEVYLVNNPGVGRDEALKTPREELLDDGLRARFEREARAAAGLVHKAIVPVYHYDTVDGRPYMTMRYLSGGTLSERIANAPYTPAEALPILERLTGALDYAHAKGIVHRDVKPGNILFDAQGSEGEAYLSDFGIARVIKPDSEETELRLTQTGVVAGTFAYASPEQAQGQKLDHRSDLYSLGVVLFEMLTGDVPYRSDSAVQQAIMHATAPIPSILERRPGLPAGLKPVIDRALAKKPDDRYSSGAALLADLRRVVDGRPKPAPRRSPSRWLWVVLALLVVAVGAYLIWPGSDPTGETPTLAPTASPSPEVPDEEQAVVAIAETTAEVASVPVAAEPAGEATVVEAVAAEPAGEAADAGPVSPEDGGAGSAPDAGQDPAATPDESSAGGGSVPDEIVFQSNRDGDTEIYIMATDGGNLRQLTHNAAEDSYPRVSPDGSRIVFESERDGNPEIYVINRDGSDETRLTVDPALDKLPAWSPDGQEIVFQSSRDGLSDIFIMNADGSDVRQITDSPLREGHTSWSVDGRLAYNASEQLYWQLYVSDADGANRQKITESTHDEWSPEWSPDGEWIVFLSERDSHTNSGIFLMRPDGSDVQPLYNAEGMEWGASWSADGTQIVFAADQPDDTADIFIMNADGSDVRRLMERGGYPSWARGSGAAAGAIRGESLPVVADIAPVPLTGEGLVRLTFGERDHYTAMFAPDQSRILLSVEMGQDWQVFEADPNGGGLLRQITRGPYDHSQAQYAPDGQTFLTSANPDGDGDIYLFDVATGDVLQQLTDDHALDYHPRWLPDGSGFIYSADDDGTGNDEIFLMTLDGRRTQLTDNDAFDGFAAPSPDGRTVAFYSGRDGDYEIYVMGIDGSGPRRLTDSRGRDASPSFSPDGQWVVFESERSGNYEIHAVPAAGGETIRLTDDPGGSWNPVFSPDGQWILFQSDREGYMDIYRMGWTR